jgi:hypothetical protein
MIRHLDSDNHFVLLDWGELLAYSCPPSVFMEHAKLDLSLIDRIHLRRAAKAVRRAMQQGVAS